MDKHKNAINYVIKLIKSLDPMAEVGINQLRPYQYSFCIDIKGKQIEIIFNRTAMDDFEYEITENQGTDRYYASEGFIKFQVYMALGQVGAISDFDISAEILNEKREWLANVSMRLDLDDRVYKVFYEGLLKLSDFLNELLKEYTGEFPEIKKDIDYISDLIGYYKEKKDFTERGANEKSLGYLKAAAVCEILELEKEKKRARVSSVLKEMDKKIYSIVAQLRKGSFLQIKMPTCIYDYAEYLKSEGNTTEEIVEPKEILLFIACGQSTEQEKEIGSKVNNCLKNKYGLNVFLAESANDLESLNSHIFRNLANCTGFIAILHKRNFGKYDTSVWINQEVGIVAFLRSTGKHIPSLVLYQEGSDMQGLIKYTIANSPTFKTDSEALSKIEDWIKEQNFECVSKLPEIDIILKEKRGQFGSASGGGRTGYGEVKYALSFRVRNKSDVNVCLENIKIDNEIIGSGTLDKTNPRLTHLPFNIGSRMTEEINLLIEFSKGVSFEKAKEDIVLQLYFEFADRTIEIECVGYFKRIAK